MRSMAFTVIFAILALSIASIEALRVPNNKPNIKNPLSISDKFKLPIDSIPNVIKSKAIPALLGSILILANPSDSSALSSGSRSGGSSFRSSSSMRSYSTTTRSYSPSVNYRSTYIAPVMPIMPFYNPFMPTVFFGPSFSTIILTVGLLYVASQFFGRLGGSSFGQLELESATVIKLNLALSSDWGYDGIIPILSNIASRSGDLSERSGLSRLLSESALALLRKSNDWVAVSHEAKTFSGDSQDTESHFQKLAIKERAKFDKETRPSPLMIQDGSKSSLAVVSLVVALTGKNNPSYKSVRSISDTREILQALAADAMTDDGNNILAVELLWSPDSPSNAITDRDLIVDYPELMRL